ncbi:MAG: hypothetical protein AAB539_04335 [Patescibacteria group bacterium]
MATMTKRVEISMDELVEIAKGELSSLSQSGGKTLANFDPQAFWQWLRREKNIECTFGQFLILLGNLVIQEVLVTQPYRYTSADACPVPVLRFWQMASGSTPK